MWVSLREITSRAQRPRVTDIRNIDLDGALCDPAAAFEGPDSVVESERLPLEYKAEIIRR